MVRRTTPYITFAILAAILLWPLATDKVLLPASMLGRVSPWQGMSEAGCSDAQWNALTWDSIAYFYPSRYLLGKSLRAGELPLWNPHQMCGTPFLASPQSAVLYPPNWLFAVLPTDLTFGLLAFLHLFAAGSFTYLFLRELGLGVEASVFGGVGFLLSGWAVVWLQLPVFLASGVWLPMSLYLSMVAFERRSALHAGLAGVTVALSLLGGHPQIWFYGLLAVGLYWVYLAATGRGIRPVVATLGLALLVFAVGFLVAAPQLLPTMELASLSHRGGTTPTADGYQAYSALAMPLRNLIGLLVPDFYGNPTNGNFWGTGEYAEFCGYVGLLPLLLIPFAFLGRGMRSASFFGGLGVLALLMATGTAINRLLYFGIPGFSSSGSPARVLYLLTFSIAVLGAMGLDRLLTTRGRLAYLCLGSAVVIAIAGFALFHVNLSFVRSIASVSSGELLSSAFVPITAAIGFLAVSVILLLLAASGKIRSSLVGWSAVGLIAADLLVFGIGYNRFGARDQVYPGERLPLRSDSSPASAEAIVRLQELAGTRRIMPLNDRWSLRTFPHAVLPPNAATAYGLYDVQGYDSLYPVQYKRLLDAAGGRDSSPRENGNMVFARNPGSPIWDLIGVEYFLSDTRRTGALEVAGDLSAYPNEGALDRCFIVHRTLRRTDQQSLELMTRKEVDLRSVALTEENVPIQVNSISPASEAGLVRWTHNTISIAIETDAPGMLVLADQYYPGWTARIDGKRLPVYRVDYCFRGVLVPGGSSIVSFSFEPGCFRRGLLMAAAGLLLLLVTAVFSALRARGGVQ